jgi:hypothetical protein
MERASNFYRDFHWGDEPETFVSAEFPKPPKVGTKLGTLHAVTYETVKDGEQALWEHEFGEEGGEKPDLVADPKSKQLYIVGVYYDITARGIID